MHTLPVYYPGGSVVVMFRIKSRDSGTQVSLTDYHAEASFYTRLLGKKIQASDLDPAKISITAVDEFTLKTTIPPEETQKLPQGPCTIRLTLSHKTDGTKLIISQKIFHLQEALTHE